MHVECWGTFFTVLLIIEFVVGAVNIFAVQKVNKVGVVANSIGFILKRVAIKISRKDDIIAD